MPKFSTIDFFFVLLDSSRSWRSHPYYIPVSSLGTLSLGLQAPDFYDANMVGLQNLSITLVNSSVCKTMHWNHFFQDSCVITGTFEFFSSIFSTILVAYPLAILGLRRSWDRAVSSSSKHHLSQASVTPPMAPLGEDSLA